MVDYSNLNYEIFSNAFEFESEFHLRQNLLDNQFEKQKMLKEELLKCYKTIITFLDVKVKFFNIPVKPHERKYFQNFILPLVCCWRLLRVSLNIIGK